MTLQGSEDWTERAGGRRRRRRSRWEKKRDPHSRRLSCSPSAYHGVRGQDLYVEFIVAESALLRFMDVFRRSAAARVIYRGTLALPPSPSRSVTKLLSLPPRLSPSFLSCLSLCFSRSLPRFDSVHEGDAERDEGIPNERYDGISFPLSLFLLSLFRLSSTLSLSACLSFTFYRVATALSFSPTRFCSQRHVVRPTH